ncbi:MAG: hypothetical protein IB616_05765 [Methanosarcinales archaeon]|nr:MAG: hypothetical protein IB616_05765 [Methanosarcinales archaeon]
MPKENGDKMRRINVGLPPRAYEIVTKDLMNQLGTNESDVVRNIVLIYLSERGYFKFLGGKE